MGYAGQGYRMWDGEKRRIIIARDVVFVNDPKPQDTAEGSTEETTETEERELNKDEDENFEMAMKVRELKKREIPMNYREAKTSVDWNKWKEAMQDEYDSLMENETWKLVKMSEEKKAIKCKWVYGIKRDAEGNTIKYKARLVAKGYSQQRGIDYEETFAPVVRYTSIRVLLAIASHLKLQVTQMDAITAFLNGELREEI